MRYAILTAVALAAMLTSDQPAAAQLFGFGDDGPPVIPKAADLPKGPIILDAPAGKPASGGKKAKTPPASPGSTKPGGWGTLGGASSSGGSLSGSTASGAGLIQQQKRRIYQINDSLLTHLKQRESARWNYEHGGASRVELDKLRHHDRVIQQLQQARYTRALAIKQQRMQDAGSEAARANIERSWAKFEDCYRKSFGLSVEQFPKYQYADLNYEIPSDPKQLAQWLHHPASNHLQR